MNKMVQKMFRTMRIEVHQDKMALGQAAALEGAAAIRDAIESRGAATIIVATGASQFEMLDCLVEADLDWGRVTAFHLDEYVGIGIDHPASFRAYLQARFVDRIDALKEFVPVIGDAENLDVEIDRLNRRLSGETVDVCFAGIGENGHLAFNDPPADFETEDPFIVVTLDEACRRQQLGEGWFPSLEAVPSQAVSMTIRQIMKSRKLVVSVPDRRKAHAVRDTVEGDISNMHPASILREHADASLHLDRHSASLLASSSI